MPNKNIDETVLFQTEKKNNHRENPSTRIPIEVKIIDSQNANNNFVVHLARCSKVRKLQRKIKKLVGVKAKEQQLRLIAPTLSSSSSETLGPLLRRQDRLFELLSSQPSLETLKVSLFVMKNGDKKDGHNDNDHSKKKDRTAFADRKQRRSHGGAPCKDANPPASEPKEQNLLLAAAEATLVRTTSNEEAVGAKQTLTLTNTLLKISFQGQFRRIPFAHLPTKAFSSRQQTNSYERLTLLCATFFGVRNPHRMLLSYVDEDGDLVRFSTDDEFDYALLHHAHLPQTPTTGSSHGSSSGERILRLFFDVKPTFDKKLENTPLQQNQLENCSASVDDSRKSLHTQRIEQPLTLESSPIVSMKTATMNASQNHLFKDGDVIQLQRWEAASLRERGDEECSVFLGFSKPKQKVVALRRRLEQEDEESVPQRKALRWIVKTVKRPIYDHEAQEGEEGKNQVITLTSCVALTQEEKKNELNERGKAQQQRLRVHPENGEVSHTGGCGKWAQFEVRHNPLDASITLRSLGLSSLHKDNFCLAFVEKKKNKATKKNQQKCGKFPKFQVRGNGNQVSNEAKFSFKIIPKELLVSNKI